MKKCAIGLVRLYQRLLSPLFPPSCRYSPTCSNYMIQAIERHGLKGILMGFARILRCHPWSKTGVDPVPDHFSLRSHLEEEKSENEVRANFHKKSHSEQRKKFWKFSKTFCF